MSDKHKKLEQQLHLASAQINDYVNDERSSVADLEHVENWLFNESEKIRLLKLKAAGCEKTNDVEEQNIRYDGIIICDSQFKIHHCFGPSYFFPGSLTGVKNNVCISELMNTADLEKLKDCVIQVQRTHRNHTVEINFTTTDSVQSDCQFEVDAKASNFKADRIVAFLTFKNNREQELADYQRIMLDSLPGMDVYLFDKNYCYIMVGGREKERFNLSNSDLVGKTLFEVLDKKTQRSLFPFYHKAISGEATEGEVRFKNELYYLVAKPITDANNNTVAGVLIVQNVTQDKELEERLIKAKRDAQNANKAKSIFIANLSHEMRTPLNSIAGFTEQLKQSNLTDKQQHYLDLIEKASEQLLYLVNEIVFLFKLGMGRVYIEKVPFSLGDLIDELGEIFFFDAKEKNLDFIVEKDDTLPDILIGDAYRLRQILMNLLVNAIKYTDNGQVKFSCEVLSDSKNKVELLFKVSDTGRGIAKKDLPYIFDLFEQGKNLTPNLRGGAGLGLGISKKLSELLDGEITVQSKLKVGSCFKLSIALKKAPTKQLIKKENRFDILDGHLKNKKILLADDDEHSLLLSGSILKKWGMDHVVVKDGQQALVELQKQKFDIVLLDINMPKKNGVQVIKKMRANRDCPNQKSPTLCITANAIAGDINKNLKAGFDDYLIKPFGEVELYNKLCNALSIKSKAKSSVVKDLPLQKVQPPDSDDVFDTNELLRTSEDDKVFYNKMVDNFIENAKALAQCFNDNLHGADWNLLAERSHKAIPSFKYFGLGKIASIFEEIETLALRDKKYDKLPALAEQGLEMIQVAINKAKAAKL